MRLHHLAIGATDLDVVTSFYRDLLGLPEVTTHRTPRGEMRSVWLRLGHALLMIEHAEVAPSPLEGPHIGHGPFLIAFDVTEEEKEVLVSSLAAAGYPIEARTAHTIYLRDPEGNRVALSSYPL